MRASDTLDTLEEKPRSRTTPGNGASECCVSTLHVVFHEGVDAFLRILNVARRGRAQYREMRVEFGIGLSMLTMEFEAEEQEVMWIAKKLYQLPEVREVKVCEASGLGECRSAVN